MSELSELNENAIDVAEGGSWKAKTLVIGAVLGASVGLLAAYLFVQNADEGAQPEIGPGEGIKLGVLLFGLLRSIAGIFEG